MNNKKVQATVIAVALAVAGYGLYRIGMQRGMGMVSSVTAAAASAGSDKADSATAAEKKPLYWHDPMVPTQKFDKPGKSPFMDMQLVPVYGDAAGDESNVVVSPRVQQNLGIRTADVTRGSLSQPLTAVGSVAYNERDVAVVQARSNGFVERLYVRAPLDAVKKGQPLADLYVPDWIAAQEEFLTARRLAGSSTDVIVDGARQRMRLAGMSDAQIRAVAESGKVHPRLTVTAPSSGVVAELTVREGMTVTTGTPMFRINGLSTVWVNAELPENQAAQIHPGTPVEARSPALPGTVLTGKVGAILAEVNAATRTLKARIELANPSGQLAPGMFATVRFNGAARSEVVLVPSEAVIQTGTRSVVMVAQRDGKFAPVDVETGAEANGQTEIRRGLVAGQKVVVSGQFLIDSEASLRGTLMRMSDPAVAAPSAPETPAAGATLHHGVGRIESIDKEEIMISHGPIASLQWGAMTMGFRLPAQGLPGSLAVGDKVVFDIRALKDGQFGIAGIAAAPAAVGTPPPSASNRSASKQ